MSLTKISIIFSFTVIILATIWSFFILFLFPSEAIMKPGIKSKSTAEVTSPIVSEPLPAVESDSNLKSKFQPPEIIKAIYVTSWSASKEDYVEYIIDIAKNTEINGVVIDIKDWSGYVAYDTKVSEVEKYKAESIRIKDISSLVQKLHEEEIYLIARLTIFQDPILARARPDLAIHSNFKLSASAFSSSSSHLSSSSLWLDNKGLAWIDPAAKECWDYNIAIAKEVVELGFDEINFDYIRFPSDGNLRDMNFPLWDGKIKKHLVIKEFFEYLRQKMPEVKLSADLFGLSTISSDDLGVGQVIEDAFEYFDYVCPMVYPSHYAEGFLGYQNPADYPYEVVNSSMENAFKRLSAYQDLQERNVGLRPWLQDFNLGATYNADTVKSEIKATYDAAEDNFKGFMVWNPSNIYTKEAFSPINEIFR